LIGYLFLIVLLSLGLLPVYAQDSGRLYGQVLDPSGAMLPGILLTLTQGNRMIDTHSGNDGIYNFQQVPEGTYALTVEAPGFEFPRAHLSIVAGHARVLNLHLTVASSRCLSAREKSTLRELLAKLADRNHIHDVPTE
jgi:hypothetical protein